MTTFFDPLDKANGDTADDDDDGNDDDDDDDDATLGTSCGP
jgi:hypothetical protein